MPDDPVILKNDAEVALLESILDQLIPASSVNAVPSAGTINLTEFLRSVALKNHAIGRLIQQGVSNAVAYNATHRIVVNNLSDEERVAHVQQLEARDPLFFNELLRQVYMGYYSRADIRLALGLSPLPTQPVGYEVAVESPGEMSALTNPVVKRGMCYRAC